jgi:plastocyanin
MRRWWFAPALVLAAAAGCGAERTGDVSDGPGGAGAVHVVMGDAFFQPERLELEAGAEVTVEVRNEGGTGHDFTVDALELSTGTVDPGQVVTATFVVPEGPTGFRCTLHGGMDGEIVGRAG